MTDVKRTAPVDEDFFRDRPPLKGRIQQSVAYWCFEKYWSLETLCRIARHLGCPSVELVDPKDWPTLKEYGLICALTMSHWFDKGMNNPEYHDMCIGKMRAAIDACAEFGFPNVITFTGYREDIPDDVGLANCVKGYKKIIGYAEKKKVNLCLEILNTRIDVEMVGHPGYQGNSTDYCLEIIRQVGSPRLTLLFDFYHVQVMQGDLIRRFESCVDHVGHIHVAGNPGRGELDEHQEINYRAVMEAVARSRYDGYVGIEYIPTRDPLEGLEEAVRVCDA